MTAPQHALSLDLVDDTAMPVLTADAARVLLRILDDARRAREAANATVGAIEVPGQRSRDVEAEFAARTTVAADEQPASSRRIVGPNERADGRHATAPVAPGTAQREDPAA